MAAAVSKDTTSDWTADRSDKMRRIDDAQAVVPYLFGAFNHPTRNGYRLGLPLLEYLTPRIDMKNGQWTFHVLDSLNLVQRVMDKNETKMIDLLVKVKRNAGTNGAQISVTPLKMILQRMEEIERKMEDALEADRNNIKKNYANFKRAILSGIASGISPSHDVDAGEADTDSVEVTKESIRTAINGESMMEAKAAKAMNLKGVLVRNNTDFYGGANLEEIIKQFSTDGCKIGNALKTTIETQEDGKLDVIKLGIRSVRDIYTKVYEAIDGLDDPVQNFKNALTSVKHERNTLETHKQVAAIGRFLSCLLAERVELFYCHSYTYFAAIVGRNHAQLSSLVNDFVQPALICSFLPALEVQYANLTMLDEFYKKEIPAETKAKSLIHSINTDSRKFFETHLAEIFKIRTNSDDTILAAVKRTVKDRMYSKQIGSSKILEHISFKDLFFEKVLNALKTEMNALKTITNSVKSILGSYRKDRRFLSVWQAPVEPIHDALFALIHDHVINPSAAKVVADPPKDGVAQPKGVTSTYRFSYNILSKVIVMDQRANPDFVANHIVPRESFSKAETLKIAAAHYFHNANSIYSCYKVFSKDEDRTKYLTEKRAAEDSNTTASRQNPDGASPFTGASTWTAITSSDTAQSPTTVYPLASPLALANIDIVSSLTRPITPKKGKPPGQQPQRQGGGKGQTGSKRRPQQQQQTGNASRRRGQQTANRRPQSSASNNKGRSGPVYSKWLGGSN